MTTRNRHIRDEVDDFANTLICVVCNTEYDRKSGDAATFYRAKSREASKATDICLCEECQQDFISEGVIYDEQMFNTDTLACGVFDNVEEWAHCKAVLLFTSDVPKTIQEVEEFFDALSNYIAWSPDDRFSAYTRVASAFESNLEHDSSPNGCHPDCAACADEEAHKRLFTDDQAKALDNVMGECIALIEREAKGDVYDYALASMQRTGHAPTEIQSAQGESVNEAREHPRAEIARLFNSLEDIAGALHASNVDADFARLRELLTKEGFNLKR